jgi:hypothetical protein
MMFQPRKVQQTALRDAVDGRVPIYVYKERMLDDVERRYPAHHCVMVDDKLRILGTMKALWENRLTTVFYTKPPTRSPRKTLPPIFRPT